MSLPFNGSSKLNQGLVAYFALDDDRNSQGIMDSKYDFNAYRSGGDNSEDKSVSSLNGKAQHFTRTSSEYITVSGKLGQYFDQGIPFSISIVFRLDSLNNYQILLGNDVLAGDGYGIYVNSSGGLLALFRRNSAGAGYIGTANITVVAGVTYHLVLTYDGGSIAASYNGYIDNVLAGNGITSGLQYSSPQDEFYIGGKQITTDGFTDGFIQHIGIWDHVLDSVARDQLWDSGNILTYGEKPVTRGFEDYPSLGYKLIAEWGLDDNEANTVTEDSLKRLDGTLNANTNVLYDSMAPAEFAGGYDWSKSASKYVDIDFVKKYIGLGKPLSVEAWTYGNDATAHRKYFGNSLSTGTVGIGLITNYALGGNSAEFYIANGLSRWYRYSNEVLLALTWNQLGFTFSGIEDAVASAVWTQDNVDIFVNAVSNNGQAMVGTDISDFAPPNCYLGYASGYDDTYKQGPTRMWARVLNINEWEYLKNNNNLGRKRLPHFEGHTELCEGLVSSWDLRDDQPTTAVVDQVGNVDGVCTANTDVLSVSGGLFGRNRMQFNGIDHIDIDAIKPYIAWDKPFSVEIWCSNDGSSIYWGGAYSSSAGEGISIYTASNKLYFNVRDATGNYTIMQSAVNPPLGLLHIILTYDGNGAPDGYESGMKNYTNSIDIGHSIYSQVGTQGAFIAAQAWVGKLGANLATGPMSITRFWSRELSQTDVNNLNNDMNGLEY